MMDELQALIVQKAGVFGHPIHASALSFTKFCQRVAAPHTKVLFFVTHEGRPLCIVKMMRSASYNQKLQNEKNVQERACVGKTVRPPKVFFEGMVGDRYVYAEEIVEGIPLSIESASKYEADLIAYAAVLPQVGSIPSTELADVFARYAPEHDIPFTNALADLRSYTVLLPEGITHGDFGRPNILKTHDGLRVIDFERGNERPLYLFDAVYFMVKTRKIISKEHWKEEGVPVLVSYTGTTKEIAGALYASFLLFEVLRRKYHERYMSVVQELRRRS
jgi:hypothetical protein